MVCGQPMRYPSLHRLLTVCRLPAIKYLYVKEKNLRPLAAVFSFPMYGKNKKEIVILSQTLMKSDTNVAENIKISRGHHKQPGEAKAPVEKVC